MARDDDANPAGGVPCERELLVAAAATAVATAIAIVAIDGPVARVLARYEAAAFWDRGTEVLEYAVGLPLWRFLSRAVLVAGMVATLAVPRWRRYARAWIVLAGTHVIAWYVTNHIKDATGRLRPMPWIEKGGDSFWRDGHAFPSGHVTLFASIVIPLAVVAPKTRPLLAIAAFIMMARVAVNAHFVSDVIGAITLLVVLTWALARGVRLGRT